MKTNFQEQELKFRRQKNQEYIIKLGEQKSFLRTLKKSLRDKIEENGDLQFYTEYARIEATSGLIRFYKKKINRTNKPVRWVNYDRVI